jgi:hypothetical protein
VKAATFEGWAAGGCDGTISSVERRGHSGHTAHLSEDVMFDPLMHHDLAIMKMREAMDAADNERRIRDAQPKKPAETVAKTAPTRRRLWFARLAHPRPRRV